MSVNPEDGLALNPLPRQSLEDIQGNILAPFNKQLQRFLFLNLGNSPANARAWLTQLVDENAVSSTNDVINDSADRKRPGAAAATSLMAVSFTSAALVTLHGELADDLVAYDAFWHGAMADRADPADPDDGSRRLRSVALVGDADAGEPSGWVVDRPGTPPVDVLITIAADSQDELDRVTAREGSRADECHVTVLAWQSCKKLPEDREHFGFKDGGSQPGIHGFTPEQTRKGRLEARDQDGTPIIAAGEFVLGARPEPGSYPGARRPDPPGWMSGGSFQVFLRLRQNVVGWKDQMDRLSSTEGITVGEKVIGRAKDGSPLGSPGTGSTNNDFTYVDDKAGEITPRFAHIRKVNPRDVRFRDRTHRLLRRGIPFAEPLTALAVQAVAEGDPVRGLAFNSFMASIEDQFEFVQRHWASNPRSPDHKPDGPDLVVGVPPVPDVPSVPDVESVLGRRDEASEPLPFGRYVWTTGAVYAFAPSIWALSRLASADKIERA